MICIACALKGFPGQTFEIEELISDGDDIPCQSKLHIQPAIVDPPTLTAPGA